MLQDGGSASGEKSGRLLLELPLPFLLKDGQLLVESQAANGLRLWCDNFSHVTLCAPVLPEGAITQPTLQWVDPYSGLEDSLRIVMLPWAYGPWAFMRSRPEVRRLLADLIDSSEYLLFCNLGGVGAWGTLAADIAYAKGRHYAVWSDWVLHEMPIAADLGLLRRMKKLLDRELTRRGSLRAIRNARLGLFHGRTVYNAYAPYSRDPHVVHDVHYGSDSLVTREQVARKLEKQEKVFRIGYVGRVVKMKGPSDWIETLRRLRELSTGRFEAVWIGDGAELPDARIRVTEAGLQDFVNFRGALHDRNGILDFLRDCDAFLFCHLTPESPRCLIESLMSGTPLVGYRSAYAEDLVSSHGGGIFVDIGDTEALSQALAELLASRKRQEALTWQSFESGRGFSDVAVFKHRSDLMKERLV